MTTERGLAENLCISIQDIVTREVGRNTCCSIWHKKRTNAWSVGVYVYVDSASKKREPICQHGEGWDIVDAMASLRDNFLKEKSKQYGTPFKNLLEFDMFIDEQNSVERNEVGAIVGEDAETEPALDAIIEQMNQLRKAILKIKK